MVDTSKIRVGDEVTVTFSGRVVSVLAETLVVDGDRSIKTDANNHRHVPKSLVTSCLQHPYPTPHEIKDGDSVRIGELSTRVWAVQAISGQRAWVSRLWEGGLDESVVSLNNLRHAT